MTLNTLGNSGMFVSKACLGTMNFGITHPMASVRQEDATRIIGTFLDAGHNLIDSADIYSAGEAEEVVGRAIARRRDDVVISTKAAAPSGPGPNDKGASRRYLTRALEASLRRLGTDYIDLYQVHHWDPHTPIEETIATLDGFVRVGKVRYIGVSNFTAAQIVKAQWAAQRLNAAPIISIQPQYSLVARYIEAEVLPTAQELGMGALVWSPLGGGLLTGRYQRQSAPDDDSRIARLRRAGSPTGDALADDLMREENFTVAETVVRIAGELGQTPAAVALAWIAHRPGVTSIIIGPRTVEQLTANTAALELPLPEAAVAELEQVSRHTLLLPVNGAQDPHAPVQLL
ncbi:aldo/keto reductase [Nonomuraea sp. NPDC004186]